MDGGGKFGLGVSSIYEQSTSVTRRMSCVLDYGVSDVNRG